MEPESGSGSGCSLQGSAGAIPDHLPDKAGLEKSQDGPAKSFM